MPVDVIMPALGMNQDTGRVISWHRREGEAVTRGDPLLEIETDKATVDVEAPATGVLSRVTAQPGDDVPVGRPVALILLAGEQPAAAEPSLERPSRPAVEAEQPGTSTEGRAGPAGERVPASPKARREAAERGLDLGAVTGSGPGGVVKAADLAAAAPAASLPGDGPSAVWETMARRTAESWSAPHFYLERECDAGRLRSWREHTTRSGAPVTYTDLLVRLAAAALANHPLVNGSWDGQRPVASAGVNIGLAVAVDRGLVVPVIHGADRLSLAEITARRDDLAGRARAGKLRPEELRGASFTISNLGMYAVDSFSAIVNSPQAAILATGRIADRVLAVGGRPEVRPAIRLTLSCDHRAIDGARAAAFLTELGDLVEEPAALL